MANNVCIGVRNNVCGNRSNDVNYLKGGKNGIPKTRQKQRAQKRTARPPGQTKSPKNRK